MADKKPKTMATKAASNVDPKLLQLAEELGMMVGVAPTERASRGPVDAPGKRHRKPPPQVRLDKRMGEVVGKKMGKKSVKHAMKGRA